MVISKRYEKNKHTHLFVCTLSFDGETDVINKCTTCLRYREHEPSSVPLSTPEAHHTANVTSSTAVKLHTEMTRQTQSDNSRDEMLR
jgi:hypothetical protein